MKPYFMNEGIENDDSLSLPVYKGDGFEVEFTFRNGTKKTVSIDTTNKTAAEVSALKEQLNGKIRLLQSMFEHGTHGQITVQGVTVRADDLSAVRVR